MKRSSQKISSADISIGSVVNVRYSKRSGIVTRLYPDCQVNSIAFRVALSSPFDCRIIEAKDIISYYSVPTISGHFKQLSANIGWYGDEFDRLRSLRSKTLARKHTPDDIRSIDSTLIDLNDYLSALLVDLDEEDVHTDSDTFSQLLTLQNLVGRFCYDNIKHPNGSSKLKAISRMK